MNTVGLVGAGLVGFFALFLLWMDKRAKRK